MAVWFGSMFELSMSGSFALHDLCLHPEYVRPLRDELDGLRYAEFEQSAQGLPLLDSFIKESARMSPSDSSTFMNCFSSLCAKTRQYLYGESLSRHLLSLVGSK
ncbi:MAG: hypothetical protein MMC33_002531 [Icmadophila ericetorum]|nr:hypothetical protein [Icmadophila ericetorum]